VAVAAIHGADPHHPGPRVGKVEVPGQRVHGYVFGYFQGSVNNQSVIKKKEEGSVYGKEQSLEGYLTENHYRA
jgi:hypothetical protein